MLRLIGGTVLATLTASSALACTIITSPDDMPPPGLNEVQRRSFYERLYYRDELASQRALWKDADYVFLAEVRSLSVVGDNRIAAGLRPVVSLKGGVGSRDIRDAYAPDFGSSCGPTRYPAIGEKAIFYARRLPWWRRVLNWGRPEIISALPLRQVVDRQIPTELRAAAARLRKTEAQ